MESEVVSLYRALFRVGMAQFAPILHGDLHELYC
jgi:hypothetical protein